MYRLRGIGIAVVVGAMLFGGTERAKAAVIVGPAALTPGTANSLGGAYTAWGIEFTANTNSTLTGFDYVHRDFGNDLTGEIVLKNITTNTSTVLVASTAGLPGLSSVTGLNVTLTQGNVYQLLASGESTLFPGVLDGLFVYDTSPAPGFGPYPVAGVNITVTGGSFHGSAATAFDNERAWASFTNITTEAAVAPTPEPASLAVLGLMTGMGGIVGWRRRNRAVTA